MTTLDREGLQNEFNMPIIDAEVVDDVPESVRDEFEEEWERETSDIAVLKKNIERANTLLDRIEAEMNSGNFSARMVEVAAGMINSITQASNVLITDTYNNRYLDIRTKLVELKAREVEIKTIKANAPRNQNLIVASREDVLKIIQEKQKELTEN